MIGNMANKSGYFKKLFFKNILKLIFHTLFFKTAQKISENIKKNNKNMLSEDTNPFQKTIFYIKGKKNQTYFPVSKKQFSNFNNKKIVFKNSLILIIIIIIIIFDIYLNEKDGYHELDFLYLFSPFVKYQVLDSQIC